MGKGRALKVLGKDSAKMFMAYIVRDIGGKKTSKLTKKRSLTQP
jgi:hypothetical protein